MENILAMNKELERGREYANRLQRWILKSGEDDERLTTSSAEDLVAKVVDSFTNTLLLFNLQQSSPHVSADNNSSCPLPANSDESESPESCKSRTSDIKARRCSPKKRKSTETWEEDSKMSPKEDGHAWRKYGQKIILNAKYPRNYFRCTHKYDQECQATKQVQRIQEDPPLYKTTYFGRHTCKNLLNPQIFLDSHDLPSPTCFLSFENNTTQHHNDDTTFDNKNNDTTTSFLAQPNHLLFSSSSFPASVKNEEDWCNNNMEQDSKIVNYVPSSPLIDEYLVSFNEDVFLPFESDDHHVDAISSAFFHDDDPVVFDPFAI